MYFRDISVIGFLIESLDDSENDIWRTALDGLVSIGGPLVRKHLQAYISSHKTTNKLEWIIEAIDQLRLSSDS